jgi:HSP20 family molecular chaperone IbpA|tara:strand:+ start:546 stop:971 length:426 start_codon:yes stop_codon:yes gene_type:complete
MGHFYWTNFDTIWNHFDTVLNNWDRMVVEPKKQLSCLPNYPHSDCWVDNEGKNLFLRFALAGYTKDNINVKASQNVLRITAKGEKEEGVKFVHHGISKKDVDFTLNIDEAFNLKKAETDYVQGLLTISIPRAKEAEIVELM